ncbi:MAG TPA: hypothetical protein VIP77_22060 [Jiangellaceae bacterium]
MSKPRTRGPRTVDPLDTLPIFTMTDGTPTGFGCAGCDEPVVDEPGELCPECAEAVLTGKAVLDFEEPDLPNGVAENLPRFLARRIRRSASHQAVA